MGSFQRANTSWWHPSNGIAHVCCTHTHTHTHTHTQRCCKHTFGLLHTNAWLHNVMRSFYTHKGCFYEVKVLITIRRRIIIIIIIIITVMTTIIELLKPQGKQQRHRILKNQAILKRVQRPIELREVYERHESWKLINTFVWGSCV